MTNEGSDDVATAIRLVPVSWLHQPRLAIGQKGAEPKIGPLAAAAIGVAVGAGIQLAGQQLRKTGPDEQGRLVQAVECNLPIDEIEAIAEDVLEENKNAKDGSLQAIANASGAKTPGGKPLPIAAAAFLAGVATGAAAARP